jgi:hypothetical protein
MERDGPLDNHQGTRADPKVQQNIVRPCEARKREPVSSTGSEIHLTIVIGDHFFYVQKPTGSSGLLRIALLRPGLPAFSQDRHVIARQFCVASI